MLRTFHYRDLECVAPSQAVAFYSGTPVSDTYLMALITHYTVLKGLSNVYLVLNRL